MVTYARPQLVESAIAQFQAQDYQAQKHLLIWNTFPKQQLSVPLTHAGEIFLSNSKDRPATLGQARNDAIATISDDSIIVTWDDDDGFAGHHLSTIARNFTEGVEWTWLDKMFWSAKGRIQGITIGSPNIFCFTKRAWKEVGGYPNVSCGEDRQLISKITSRFKGVRVHLKPEEISFVYGWDNGLPHLSGHGFDQPGQVSGYEKVRLQVEAQVRTGAVKTGQITLHPRLLVDYQKQARDFIAQTMNSRPVEDDVCIVMLGRYGDIVNALPIAQHVACTYRKPHFMVAKEFASVLDGVSYVTPFVFDGPCDRLRQAMEIAKKRFKHIIRCQIWGHEWPQERQCEAYNIESWRAAGFLNKFEDKTWRPFFDQENRARGEAAMEKALQGRKEGQPLFVVNLTHSHSSPFPEGPQVLAELRRTFAEAFIVDVAQLKLDGIHDLLPLIRSADVVVAIDTSLIHLTAATGTSLVALLNDNPWQGSRPRTERWTALRYKEAAKDPKRLCDAIVAIGFNCAGHAEFKPPSLTSPPHRFVLHAVERHEEKSPAERARKAAAWASWDALYAQHGVIPCHLWNYPRNAMDIGDPRPLPYLKDVLRAALDQAGDDDIVFFTNDDNVLHGDLPGLLRFHVSVYGAVALRRCEFRQNMPLKATTAQWIAAGQAMPHCGRDIFAFQKRWMEERWDDLPDYVLGAPEWDFGMSCLIRQSFGLKSDSRNIFQLLHPAELFPGCVGHVYHKPQWTVKDSASNRHNRKLFQDWCQKHGEGIRFYPDGGVMHEKK